MSMAHGLMVNLDADVHWAITPTSETKVTRPGRALIGTQRNHRPKYVLPRRTRLRPYAGPWYQTATTSRDQLARFQYRRERRSRLGGHAINRDVRRRVDGISCPTGASRKRLCRCGDKSHNRHFTVATTTSSILAQHAQFFR